MIRNVTHKQSPRPAAVLTPAEVAEILKCSRAHVYRLIRAKALPSIDISVPPAKLTKTRILQSDLDAYLNSPRADPQ